jgi:hypothetical protein
LVLKKILNISENRAVPVESPASQNKKDRGYRNDFLEKKGWAETILFDFCRCPLYIFICAAKEKNCYCFI